jgi:beta-galactosidase
MHSGLLRHDETLDRGGQEIARMEMAGRDNGEVPARVALLHDYESQWVYDVQPHSARASYVRQTMLFYTALRSLGVDVDIRHPDTDLSGYAVVVAPALQLMGPDRAAHLSSYAANTRFVFGPRTAYRTATGRVQELGQPGPLRGLVGQRLLNFDGLRPGLTVHAGGYEVETWAESYEPTGADVLVTYDDGPLAGQAAVTRKGNALSIGAWSAPLVTEVLEQVLTESGVPTIRLPEGLRVSHRGDTEIWMNFAQQPATLPDGSQIGPVSFQFRG